MKTEATQTGITIEGLIKVEKLKAILTKYHDDTLFIYIHTILDENKRVAHPKYITAKHIKEGIAELQDNEMLCYHYLSTSNKYTEIPYGKIEKSLRMLKYECQKIAIITYLAQERIEDYQRLLGDDRTEESIGLAMEKYGYGLSTTANIYKYTKDKKETARTLSAMCIALMYSTWEREHQRKIAKILNHKKKKEIKCDIIDDLRKIRNYMLHPRDEVEELTILKDIWKDTGTTIYEKTLKIMAKIQEIEPNQIRIATTQ